MIIIIHVIKNRLDKHTLVAHFIKDIIKRILFKIGSHGKPVEFGYLLVRYYSERQYIYFE